MLACLKAYVSSHLLAATASLHYLMSRFWLSFTTILVIALVLTIFGLCESVLNGLRKVALSLEANQTMVLYLKPTLTKDAQTILLQEVLKFPGVKNARLQSSAASLQALRQQAGMEDILRYLPENPLPPTILIQHQVMEKYPEQLAVLSQDLKNLSGVTDVSVNMAGITQVAGFIHFITKIGIIFRGFLAFAVVYVIASALRFFISERRDELRILTLLGATETFMLRPFFYGGLWYGLLGGLVSLIGIESLLWLMQDAFHKSGLDFSDVISFELSLEDAYFILITAGLLGVLGVALIAKKQLKNLNPMFQPSFRVS